MSGCGCGSSSNNDDDDNMISPEQKREEKRRTDFLKNSIKDMNSLYESLGNRGMRIRPEEELDILSKTRKENIIRRIRNV